MIRRLLAVIRFLCREVRAKLNPLGYARSIGVTIGSRVIIGAGSVVTREIPDNSVAVGVPAKVIKTVDVYLEQMQKKSLKCGHLKGLEKEAVLKRIFGITTKASALK